MDGHCDWPQHTKSRIPGHSSHREGDSAPQNQKGSPSHTCYFKCCWLHEHFWVGVLIKRTFSGSQVGGNLHCIMAFQRVNWQKLGPWALNLENLRHDFHHSGTERAHGSVAEETEERTSSKRLANLGRSHSMGSQKDTSWKRLSNTTEYRQRSSPDSDLEEDITDWKGLLGHAGGWG